MARYHINNSDEVGKCKASKEACPFGGDTGDENHYSDPKEAEREASDRLEKKHGLINKIYKAGAKDTSEAESLHPDVKKRILKETTEGKNKLHPSVVAKVFANDKDELVRRKVAENVKSQNVLRKMSDDDSEKVRLSVAKTTKNPEVLKKLSQDSDSKVRNAALKNDRMPKRAKKKTVEAIKAKQAEARANKSAASDVDLSDSSHFKNADSNTMQTTMNPETLTKVRASGKSAHELKGFDEKKAPTPGLKGDYQMDTRSGANGKKYHTVRYYKDLNDSSYTTSKSFSTEDGARKYGREGLLEDQKPYSEEETAKVNKRRLQYMESRKRSNYTGD